MLKTIQIIALLQGVFLIMILFVKRKDYKRLNFWLLLTTIISLLFHIIGDDDFNLIQEDADWYVFHSPLIITLFFLLIKYDHPKHNKFKIRDLLYFIPYLLYVGMEIMEGIIGLKNTQNELLSFLMIEVLITLTMISYLVYIIYDVSKDKNKRWMLYFIIPYAIACVLDAVSFIISEKSDLIPYLESYGIIGLCGLLLYAILFKLIVSPKSVLPKAETKSYKTSSLHTTKIESHKTAFLKLMHEEKLFMDSNITVGQIAQKMGIPRQHLSEVLNVHMKSNFQDYINKCRAEAFVECLKHKKFQNYTIMGIATEVGFKSKSSFNTTFKKLYGVTPSAFRKSLSTT